MNGKLLAGLCAGMMSIAAPVAAQGVAALQAAADTGTLDYNIYGPSQTSRQVQAEVVGGRALQVTVSAAAANPWDIGATAPVDKPIAKGDRVTVSFWARAPQVEGAATISIPFVGVMLVAAPYTPLVSGPVVIGREWKLHKVSGVASVDAASGAAMVGMHLGTIKGVVEFGPITVSDPGKAG